MLNFLKKITKQACLRSAAMFAVSGDQLRQSKSSRAGLQLSVGRFHRWMADVRLGKFVHEYVVSFLRSSLQYYFATLKNGDKYLNIILILLVCTFL